LADHSVHILRYIWLQIISRPFDGGGGGDNNIIYKTTYYHYYNNILYCDYDNAPAVPQVVVARARAIVYESRFPVYCCTTRGDDIIACDECFIIIIIIIIINTPPVQQDFFGTEIRAGAIDDRGTRYSRGADHRPS